jgi:hypothetical protein
MSGRFQDFQCRTVFPVRIEGRDGFRKDLLPRDGVEQGHARAEFHVVGRTQDVGYAVFARRHDEPRAFDQARSEQVVLKVCSGFRPRADSETLRHGAEAETGDLREDEPHPMRSFPPA